ncbi:helix-turn-helix transcriptional regulator [Vibrio sp. MA40-2]|uniref:helix-turn-helix transcriptional regulator n=1 Tax=Vibrio sp. MA40-2 TaxID=3391828 RepID=UPI0039A68624
MKTTDRILLKLKKEGAITAKQLSEDLNMTSMGARQHLQSLQELELLSFFDRKVKVGRPTRHWQLTAKGHAQFSDRHGELTVQVIEAVESLFGEEGIKKVALEREKQTFERYQLALSQVDTLKDKLIQLTQLREEDGYMAELEQTEHGFVLIENHCPICKAAQSCPSLCQSELNVFEQLLGSFCSIRRTEHIIKNERRCVYKITSI